MTSTTKTERSTADESALPEPGGWIQVDVQTLLDAGEVLCRYAADGARLLLSGLLLDQRAEIEAAYASRGVYVKVARSRDGWVALEAVGMESYEGGLCS